METSEIVTGRNGPRTRMTREARRSLILSAAAEMFQKHGYAAASIDAIAMASGVSGPAIYRYFNRKSELLVALFESAAAEAVEAMEQALAPNGGCATIHGMSAVLVDRALRESAVIGLLQASVIDMEDSDRARLGAIRAALVDRLAGLLCQLRGELSSDDGRIHIEAALAIIGQLARRRPDPAEAGRLRIILCAVLSA